MSSWFDRDGYVKIDRLPKENKRYKPKEMSDEERREIEMCLNCDLPKCNGNCLKVRTKKNGRVKHY